jgi:hypothetical protein
MQTRHRVAAAIAIVLAIAFLVITKDIGSPIVSADEQQIEVTTSANDIGDAQLVQYAPMEVGELGLTASTSAEIAEATRIEAASAPAMRAVISTIAEYYDQRNGPMDEYGRVRLKPHNAPGVTDRGGGDGLGFQASLRAPRVGT